MRVPLQVLRTSPPGRAWLWYLFQLVRMQSLPSLSLRVVIIQFLISWGIGILLWSSSLSSKSLLQQIFHSRKVHSDAVIRKRWVVPVLILPFADLIFRRGRAMINVMGCVSTGIVMTSSPGDGIGPEAGRLGLSHWAGPSVTGSAKVSQSFYRGIIIMILTKGKPVPLAWEFIYKLGEVTRVTSTILPNMGRKCVTEA